jgi:hypothetical protein
MNCELYVEALLRLRLVGRQRGRQVVLTMGIEPRGAASTGVVVFAYEDAVGQERLLAACRRPDLKEHFAEKIAIVEAVPVDLESTADVRLIVRSIVKGKGVDLDRTVVSRRVGRGHKSGGRDHGCHDKRQTREPGVAPDPRGRREGQHERQCGHRYQKRLVLLAASSRSSLQGVNGRGSPDSGAEEKRTGAPRGAPVRAIRGCASAVVVDPRDG